MKKTLALIVSTLTVIGMATIASAQADGTYTFEGSAGDPAGYDGSTVTITGGVITSFDLLEGNTYLGPLPPATSGPNGAIFDDNPASFNIFYDPGSYAQLFLGDVTSAADGGNINEIFVSSVGYESGNWTFSAVSAPDAASTAELLGAAMIGLGACRRFLRR